MEEKVKVESPIIDMLETKKEELKNLQFEVSRLEELLNFPKELKTCPQTIACTINEITNYLNNSYTNLTQELLDYWEININELDKDNEFTVELKERLGIK